MPYEVRKDHEKFCVFNTETDENKGCSDSRDQAVAHLKVLYSKESEMAVEEMLAELDADNEESEFGDNYVFSDSMKEYKWEGPICFEGVVTGDNRVFSKNSINWQEETLPWPLRWQKASGQGHAGSVPIGRVDGIERKEDGAIHGFGVIIPELSGEAAEYLRILESNVGGGVSVDGDSAEFTVMEQEKGQPRVEFSSMRLRALSAVDVPAFNGARIHLIDSEPESTKLVEATEELLETIDLASKKSLEKDEEDSKDEETKDEPSPEDNFKAMIAAKKAKAKKKVEASYGWNIDDSLVAAAIPTLPSTEAFLDPEFDGPTALTVTPDGRVYGHLALFNTCHLGFPGTCVKPPKGSNYQYFHTGQIETVEGDLVETGRLTFKTGHADMNASPRIAADHYDNTGTVAADVRAGEDKFGIWVVGALRPHLTDEDIRAFRCAPLSGDWRRIAGKLELVGALGVNTPGFPVPRVKAMVASGETETLFTFLEDDDEEFQVSDYELSLRQDKKASLAASISMQIGPIYSDYELDLRYGKKVALASAIADFEDLPVGKITEKVPKAPTKKEIEGKVKNYTTSEIFADLKLVRELLDDPKEKMPKKVRNGLEEIYKAVTLLGGNGTKFSSSGLGLDIITASGLEVDEWERQLELSGLNVVEFYNQCHGEDGKFCEGKDGPGRLRDKPVSGRHPSRDASGNYIPWKNPDGSINPAHGVGKNPDGSPQSEAEHAAQEAAHAAKRAAGGTPNPKQPQNPQNPQQPQQQQQSYKVNHKTYENFRQARQNSTKWAAAATVAAVAIHSPFASLLQGIASTAGFAALGSPAILGLIFGTAVIYSGINAVKAHRYQKDYNLQVDKKLADDRYNAAEAKRRQRHNESR